ncbi:MAG TPA: hypothetical protein DHV28_06270 [Ignavibacteriales bacterium]|nr:hypothetical protein [Ignavibacteriales bacterium]
MFNKLKFGLKISRFHVGDSWAWYKDEAKNIRGKKVFRKIPGHFSITSGLTVEVIAEKDSSKTYWLLERKLVTTKKNVQLLKFNPLQSVELVRPINLGDKLCVVKLGDWYKKL